MIPAGAPPAKMLLDPISITFLQYDEEPAENSASFALDRFVNFSNTEPALPVIVPLSS